MEKIKEEQRFLLDNFDNLQARVEEIENEYIEKIENGYVFTDVEIVIKEYDRLTPGSEVYLFEKYGDRVYTQELAGIGEIEKLKILSKEDMAEITEKKTYDPKLKKMS